MSTVNTTVPGAIVLLGSGETAPSTQKVYDRVFARLDTPPRVAILETPAGFEPNSEQVAQDIGQYLHKHLQNYQPQVTTIPARRSVGELSTNNPALLEPLYAANVILTGPGSPTYAVRHLRNSLCWQLMRICHRLGYILFLSSAATVAVGCVTLPVYEIYKVGLDLYWQPGLDFFASFGLNLTAVPHWNNRSGGADLDTRRCYMGVERFQQLLRLLPDREDTTILGIDENTAVILVPATGQGEVIGQGAATILQGNQTQRFASGASFDLCTLGNWQIPQGHTGLDAALWHHALSRITAWESQQRAEQKPPADVQTWLQQRGIARAERDWVLSDALRDRIRESGWDVRDTPQGQEVVRLSDA